MERDGIKTEEFFYSEDQGGEKEVSAEKILNQFDTGHTGFLTKEEFMVLADIIVGLLYILTPLILYSRGAGRGAGQDPATPGIRRLFKAATGAERMLIALFPFLRGLCWNAVMYGVK